MTDALRRAWASWCRFWFTPADPTPLALMRIVAGLLTLYVHVAYTIDLNAFFGAHGWVDRVTAERAFREYPIFVPAADDTAAVQADRFRWPSSVELRQALREFLDRLHRAPDVETRVLTTLGSLPADEGERQQVHRY